MSNFDRPTIYYKDGVFAQQDGAPDEGRELVAEYRKTVQQYHKFFREFSVGADLKYRQRLVFNYRQGDYFIDVDFDDLLMFNEESAMNLKRQPAKYIPAMETAAKEVADELTRPRPAGQEELQDIQVILHLRDAPSNIRKIKSSTVSQMIRLTGIVVAASQVRARATRVTLQCRTCRHTISDQEIKPGLEGFQLPRRCNGSNQSQLQRCPMDPYHIVPDKCKCVDFQTLKLQETPEDIPHGEMPRHMQLYVDRYLTDKVVPGNRITITGILSIKKMFAKQGAKGIDKTMSGIRAPYIRVLGVQVETSGSGRTDQIHFTPEEEREFRSLSKKKDIYEIITNSIAPSIYGSDDIKRSIACLLFGGSRKRLPDGLTRRGDINVLLLGDPGTAKSQLLKFVEKVAPIAVYTSGKGSSAAGLTASVTRDPQSRSFIMEGGAMVLADGGVVCIDEFDKMREDDRVAIHEAMEQQTISIAKAGITTTLNSRCSVLAAANSVFGRWDDSKGDENIDFMPTILSRFDMIYVVKDTHDPARDTALAKHVLSVHMGTQQKEKDSAGELELTKLKKFIAYARSQCAPRLSAAASDKLINNYVKMRNPPTDPSDNKKRHRSAIPITVRQLEAIIRTSESLAKMELQPFADEGHVEEAMRLFQVSTMAAAASGNLAGIEGFTSSDDQESFGRIERQMKKRFAIGTYVSEALITGDFVRQSYPESLVRKVIQFCVRRGDFQYRLQRKMLYRLK